MKRNGLLFAQLLLEQNVTGRFKALRFVTKRVTGRCGTDLEWIIAATSYYKYRQDASKNMGGNPNQAKRQK